MTACPLCRACGPRVLRASVRTHLACAQCGLIFVPAEGHPSLAAERARYEHHRNSPADQGYRAFLSRLVEPLLEVVPEGTTGLDHGCGPGPTLAVMLTERGRPCRAYDPHFAPETALLARTWDFVTCTEVIEHFRRPREDWEQLASLVAPQGWLGVTTPEPPDDDAELAAWPPLRDLTHLCFYRPRTLAWIAEWLRFELHAKGAGVALLRAPTG